MTRLQARRRFSNIWRAACVEGGPAPASYGAVRTRPYVLSNCKEIQMTAVMTLFRLPASPTPAAASQKNGAPAQAAIFEMPVIVGNVRGQIQFEG